MDSQLPKEAPRTLDALDTHRQKIALPPKPESQIPFHKLILHPKNVANTRPDKQLGNPTPMHAISLETLSERKSDVRYLVHWLVSSFPCPSSHATSWDGGELVPAAPLRRKS